MFNRERLKEAVAEYKKCFVQKWWPDEKYKWEMVKCFQVNWDVNADDFAAMLAKSLVKAAAILNAANYYPVGMITEFAEKAEYSRAAEPPVQCGVSHLSRRTEPHCL